MRSLALLFATAVCLTCLLAPFAYELVLAVWPEPIPPFRRVFDRVGMLVLLIVTWRRRKELPLGELLHSLRQGSISARARAALLGISVSLGTGLLAAPLILLRADIERSGMPLATLAWRALTDIPGACIVGWLEECFFRGIVLCLLMRSLRLPVAVLLSATFYAGVHFLKPDKSFGYEFSIFEGARYMAAVLRRAASLNDFWSFLGLLTVGVTLSVAYLRSRSLWLCIGMHAGWFLIHKLATRGLTMTSLGERTLGEVSWHLLALPPTWFSITLALGLVWKFSGRSQNNGLASRAALSAKDGWQPTES